MRPGRRSGLIALCAVCALVAFGAGSAWAAFPLAQNGNIAYQRYDGSGFDIGAMGPTGTGQVVLTPDADYEVNPSYSPDGRRIVFIRGVGGDQTNVWVMNADGTSQAELTNTPAIGEYSPVFSPDGKTIAYNSNPEGPPSDLYLMNA